MNNIQAIRDKGDELIACTDKLRIRQLVPEFIELLRKAKFKPKFEESKEQTLIDAQQILGSRGFIDHDTLLPQTKKEVASLIELIDTGE